MTTTPITNPVDTSELIYRDHHAIGLAGRGVSPPRRHLHAISSRALAAGWSVQRVVPAVDGSGKTEASVLLYADAVCGARGLLVANTWGTFTRTNPTLADDGACQFCAWHVALTSRRPADELDHLTPTTSDQRALARHLPDPLAARHIAETILDAAIFDPEGSEPIQPYRHLVDLLASVNDHAPIVLRVEDCFDGDCPHHRDNDAPGENCPPTEAIVTCPRCGVQPLQPVEDQNTIVAADVRIGPCQVFTDLMSRYTPTRPEEARR